MVSAPSLLPTGRPRRIDAAGTATTASIVIATSTRATAFRVAIGVAGATGAGPVWAARRVASRPRRTRVPTRLSSAGVSVIAISTAIATHAAPTVPISPRNGMPVTLSARRAMITVEPANTTALPEVPVARAIDSRTAYPSMSWRRWRLMMNSA